MQKQIAKNVGAGPVSAHKIGNTQKGITLIALVITIIVLLILAGVTINMVLGDDGIIAQAQAAKLAQIEGSLKEEIEIYEAELELAARTGVDARSEADFFEDLIEKKLLAEDHGIDNIVSPLNNEVVLYRINIEFTIADMPNKVGTNTYQAKKGMTWAEWIESDYNTITEEPHPDWPYEDVEPIPPYVELTTISGFESRGEVVYLFYWYTWEGYMTYEDKLVLGSSEIVAGYTYGGKKADGTTNFFESVSDEDWPEIPLPFTITYGDITYNLEYNLNAPTWEGWINSVKYNTINLSMGLITPDGWLISFNDVLVEIYDSNGDYVGTELTEIDGGNYTMRETPYFKIDNNIIHVPSSMWGNWMTTFDIDYSIWFEDDEELQTSYVTYNGKRIYYNGEVVTTSSEMVKYGEYTTTP